MNRMSAGWTPHPAAGVVATAGRTVGLGVGGGRVVQDAWLQAFSWRPLPVQSLPGGGRRGGVYLTDTSGGGVYLKDTSGGGAASQKRCLRDVFSRFFFCFFTGPIALEFALFDGLPFGKINRSAAIVMQVAIIIKGVF